MEWTSVKDELPSSGQTVLGFFSNEGYLINDCWVPGQRVLKYIQWESDGEFYFMDGTTGNSYKPTHWMPMPKAPKDN